MYKTMKKLQGTPIVLYRNLQFSDNEVSFFRDMFDSLKEAGTISIESNFENDVWLVLNEAGYKWIHFNINELCFAKAKQARGIDINKLEFVLAIKYFALILLKKHPFRSVYETISEIVSIFSETLIFDPTFVTQFKNKLERQRRSADQIKALLQFIDFFECDFIDYSYYEVIEKMYENSYNRTARTLTQFDSMFKLSEVIDDFINNADDLLLEKYFPIILWWKITMIIPLRVTEFVITPYGCIEEAAENKYKIKIRRSKLKGRRADFDFDHSIDACYRIEEIEITREIFDLVNHYKSLVDKYDNGQRKFLFSKRSLIKMRNFAQRQGAILPDVFQTEDLRSLLKKFFSEIVCGERYQFVLVDKGVSCELGFNEIEDVDCMDTRHFAIMNMVLSDIPIIVAKNLAGHDSIDTTYGYYQHIDTFARSYTYFIAKEKCQRKEDVEIFSSMQSRPPVAKVEYYLPLIKKGVIKAERVDRGWCMYKEQDFIECEKTAYDCNGQCNFFIPEVDQTYMIENRIRENSDQIESSVRIITEMIKERKRIKDFNARIATERMKIRTCINQNSKIIADHIMPYYKG